MTKILYFDDPLLLEFPAEVIDTWPLPDGRSGVVLAATCFYPTSGGQEHDDGSIGEARVLNVYKDQDERIVHILDRQLAKGSYPGKVDRDRRQRAMQHHTGQHILSAAFLRLLGVESVSANINAYSPSTIDLDVDEVKDEDMARVEAAVNQLIFENRLVKTYFITDEEVASIPFRKPPKVSGSIRVVEVEGFDHTPCGGTHCSRTGSIGILKILRTERINHKFRIHFVAGFQALEVLGMHADTAQKMAALLNTRPAGVLDATQKLMDQNHAMQSEIILLREQMLDIEASDLVDGAELVGAVRLVVVQFRDRAAPVLRSLAVKVAAHPSLAAVLASHDGQKISLVAAFHPDCNLDSRQLVAEILLPIGCRSGGDPFLSQGGGTAGETALDNLATKVKAWICSQN